MALLPNMGTHPRRDWQFSKRLIFSYLFDWILILFTSAIGSFLKRIEPNRHEFSLFDPSISYPYTRATVSSTVSLLAALIAPAGAILVACLIFIPGRTAARNAPKTQVWQRKLWELNVGWMGLGMAYLGVFAVTEALKIMFGKPRPDLLSRCKPDISALAHMTVGGLGQKLTAAFAGLTYLTLWLCSKLSISFPYLAPRPHSQNPRYTSFSIDDESNDAEQNVVPVRNQSAAAPTYLIFVAIAPILGATYISATRWINNRHHGFDIIFGAALGILFAWLGFRWYHTPLSSSGAGWAWAARNPDRAFFAGVGFEGYAGHGLGKDVEQAASPPLGPQTAGEANQSEVAQKGETNV
ncbi:hypothetical protein ACJ72_01657 [Emergomyces africanus]|uniref:Phosphatidic acid phosphatase type 2/haloperoxidase domain-containing protein n=1 Tax=Emergomyces africanus TaxID=1955775 RepID=A0A1B7P4M3_9EURO|nr:hypothetical protein ACJ72_01657 [Emergomyces africanus]